MSQQHALQLRSSAGLVTFSSKPTMAVLISIDTLLTALQHRLIITVLSQVRMMTVIWCGMQIFALLARLAARGSLTFIMFVSASKLTLKQCFVAQMAKS